MKIFLILFSCVYVFADERSWEYKGLTKSSEQEQPQITPKVQIDSNKIKEEYLKHYLDAFLSRQAKQDADKHQESTPNAIGTGLTEAKVLKESNEYQEGVRIIRRNQADQNVRSSDSSSSSSQTKEIWRG